MRIYVYCVAMNGRACLLFERTTKNEITEIKVAKISQMTAARHRVLRRGNTIGGVKIWNDEQSRRDDWLSHVRHAFGVIGRFDKIGKKTYLINDKEVLPSRDEGCVVSGDSVLSIKRIGWQGQETFKLGRYI